MTRVRFVVEICGGAVRGDTFAFPDHFAASPTVHKGPNGVLRGGGEWGSGREGGEGGWTDGAMPLLEFQVR